MHTEVIPPQYRDLSLFSKASGAMPCDCSECKSLSVSVSFLPQRGPHHSPAGSVVVVCLCGCRVTRLLSSWHDAAPSWQCQTPNCPGYVPTMVLTKAIEDGRRLLLRRIAERAVLS
jgi:hypothetical protein